MSLFSWCRCAKEFLITNHNNIYPNIDTVRRTKHWISDTNVVEVKKIANMTCTTRLTTQFTFQGRKFQSATDSPMRTFLRRSVRTWTQYPRFPTPRAGWRSTEVSILALVLLLTRCIFVNKKLLKLWRYYKIMIMTYQFQIKLAVSFEVLKFWYLVE